MRLLLLSLLFISAVHALECLEYAEVVYGDKVKARDISRISDTPVGPGKHLQCKANERCTMYYYFLTNGSEKYVLLWAECWGGDNKVMPGKCNKVKDGEAHGGSGFKEYVFGCACDKDRCNTKEEMQQKWKEHLGNFPVFTSALGLKTANGPTQPPNGPILNTNGNSHPSLLLPSLLVSVVISILVMHFYGQ